MSIRAVAIGLLLGGWICGFAFYNDWVIGQRFFIGHLIPLTLFGVTMALLLIVNPVIGRLRRAWMLRGSEIAVVTAIGLAACGWPTTGFFYTFAPVVGAPAHLHKTKSSWQAAKVFSYVPGASPLVADGYATSWRDVARDLRKGVKRGEPGLEPVWKILSDRVRGMQPEALKQPGLDAVQEGVNRAIAEKRFSLAVDSSARPPAVEKHLAARERRQAQLAALKDRHASLEKKKRKRKEARSDRIQEVQSALESAQSTLEERRAALDSLRARDAPAAKITEQKRAVAEAEAELRRLDAKLGELRLPIRRIRQKITRTEKMMATRRAQAKRALQKANRALLAQALPSILPQPEAEGVLLANGRADSFVTNTLIQGWSGTGLNLPIRLLPWEVWWPTLWLWGGLGLLMAVACLCLALIVHPQWSRRELLAYPMARVVQEMLQRPTDGGLLPAVARNRVFWYGLGALVVIYLLNGLNAWLPDIFFVKIPRNFDQFEPIKTLFPALAEQAGAWAVFKPVIFPTIVAFAFFLSTDVSLSLGLVGIGWLVFGAIVTSQGISLQHDYMGAQNKNMLLLGAWLAFAVMIVYVGRSYYFHVAKSAIPLMRRDSDTPAYAQWAARLLAVCFVLSVALLMSAGLAWGFAALIVALILLMFVLIARLNAETGAFFIQPYWMPVGVLTALLGAKAVGPEAYIVMALACVILIGDSREVVMPFLTNGLRIADRPDLGPEPGAGTENAPAESPRDRRCRAQWLGPGLLGMVLVGFVVALLATFYWQYNIGITQQSGFQTKHLPAMPFNKLDTHVSELAAKGELTESITLSGWERVLAISPDTGLIAWMGLGFALVVGCAIARLRLPWWPLHPALFLLWGTFGGYRFAWCFFLGWLIKVGVVRLGGAKAYHETKPLMVGVIAGELLMGLFWLAVGAIYYWVTGLTPVGSPVRLL